MKCQNCGAEVTGRFCSNCGAVVERNSYDNYTPQETVNNKPVKKKKKSKIGCLVVFIIVVIVAAVVAIAGIIISSEKKAKDIYDDYNTAEQSDYDYSFDDEDLDDEDYNEDYDDEEIEITEPSTTAQTSAKSKLVNGMRPEFKKAMDSYEAFFNEYYDFMKKYQSNPSDLSMIAKYGELMKKEKDMQEKFDEWKDDDLNNTELKYYMEVNNRIQQKAIDVIG